MKIEMKNEVRRLAYDPKFLQAIAEAVSGHDVKKKVKKKKDEQTMELFL